MGSRAGVYNSAAPPAENLCEEFKLAALDPAEGILSQIKNSLVLGPRSLRCVEIGKELVMCTKSFKLSVLCLVFGLLCRAVPTEAQSCDWASGFELPGVGGSDSAGSL
jgi:hypothetical protein